MGFGHGATVLLPHKTGWITVSYTLFISSEFLDKWFFPPNFVPPAIIYRKAYESFFGPVLPIRKLNLLLPFHPVLHFTTFPPFFLVFHAFAFQKREHRGLGKGWSSTC